MQEGISRTTRHLPPADYLLRFDPYSCVSKHEKYEGGLFSGYKWKLCLYPEGDKLSTRRRKSFVSLYLIVAEDESLPAGWEIYANFKLFVYDHLNDSYLTIQDVDGSPKGFHEMKKTRGFAELLALGTFKDPVNGYLVGDSCAFGAEVFVIRNTVTWESLSFVDRCNLTKTFSWKIENFSSLPNAQNYSEAFSIGGKIWKLKIHPKREIEHVGKVMSLYLVPSGWERNSSKLSTYAVYKLRVIDKLKGKHREREHYGWFGPPTYSGLGARNMISLKDLHQSSNGFILKDCLTVEVEIVSISKSMSFSAAVGSTHQT